ncbi:MAG: hypothetical protein WA666_11190 [Nitrospirota bacterium]
MVRHSKRLIKENQRKRLPFFLAVSLAFHSIAAVTAPAIFDLCTNESQNNQNLTYVDVVRETKPAETLRDKSRNIPAQHAPAAEKAPAPIRALASRVVSPPEAESPATNEVSAPTASSKEISAPAEKPAPSTPPEPDISAAAAHMAGPLKSSDKDTLIASVGKNISAPGVPDETRLSDDGSPGEGLPPAGEKGTGEAGWAGAAGAAEGAEDIVGVGDIKSYADGAPVTTSSGEGAGLKHAEGFSSVTGMGPAFSPAEINAAGGTGASGTGAGKSEGAGSIPAAHKEKAAAAGQGPGAGQYNAALTAGSTAGNGAGGDNIGTGGKKMASAGTLYASFAGVPGGGSGAGEKQGAGVEAIKTETSQAAGFGHAALEAVPETGIEIKSPSDGSVIDCMESADITVAGEVKGKVDKVKVYVNGVYYEARAANGSFKIRIPARAEKNFIHAEGYDIYGDRCVSKNVTCRIKNLSPVDVAVYLNCGSGAKLKLKYAWGPYPLKGKEGKERDNEFKMSGGDNQKILTVARGARGIYTIGIENASSSQEQAEVRVCLFPRDPDRKRVRKWAMVRLRGGTAADKLVRILLPEGVFWDEDGWFSGVLESTRDTVKYKQPEGIAWKEEK